MIYYTENIKNLEHSWLLENTEMFINIQPRIAETDLHIVFYTQWLPYNSLHIDNSDTSQSLYHVPKT